MGENVQPNPTASTFSENERKLGLDEWRYGALLTTAGHFSFTPLVQIESP